MILMSFCHNKYVIFKIVPKVTFPVKETALINEDICSLEAPKIQICILNLHWILIKSSTGWNSVAYST